jgi:TatD DNase family protein
MQFIDTHCHLFWDSFNDDLEQVIQNARACGVGSLIIPATDLKTYEAAREIAGRFNGVYLAVGIHPHDSKDLQEEMFERVRDYSYEDKVVAIGEIGLDYYYDYSPKSDQHAALGKQLEIAKERKLPVIIHNRESDDDVLAICKEHQDGTLRGQFHCFSSSPEYAEKVMEAGFHISFTGNVTFKKTDLDDALTTVSENRLLIETDAPFMTPVPHRGKRNEPMYIPLIAEYYAKLRNTTVDRIAEITTQNAIALYNLPAEIEDSNA